MKRIRMAALFAATVLLVGQASMVLADEIIIHRDGPDVVDVPPPPHDVVIEHRRPDCSTTTVHRDDGMGDSSTTTRRDCD